ncbi:MAG: S8 family peptidase [Deltaproteobacteria bacterium]|nr:S8 family peptidase [Deltaproteobacteria bacterium]
MLPDGLPHLRISTALARSEAVVVRGGGDTYTREDVAAHSRALRAAFGRSLQNFEGKLDADLAADLIVQVTTSPGRSAAKERQHLKNLGFEIVSLSSSESNVAVARISRDLIPRLAQKLDRYADSSRHIGKTNFAAIESLTPVSVERKIEPGLADAAREQAVNCLVTLYASLPTEMKATVATRIAGGLRERGKREVATYSYANGIVGIAATLTRAEMTEIGEQYMFVRSFENNTEVVSEAAIQADPVPAIIQIEHVQCEMPAVVVDSGINGNCSLLAGLVLRTINELPQGTAGPHAAHGTFIASRVIYGDDITTVLNHRALPWCPVIDVQVTGMDNVGNRVFHTPAKLGEILQRVVPTIASQSKVVNLSLGTNPIAEGQYSTLARLIDFLSREHKVLFIISAGNIQNPTANPPAHYLDSNSRILSPSEALLALTVGSIARFCQENCVAREREISPFSRRGPGADRALKPELAMHGGNVAFDGMGWTTTPIVAAYGLDRDGAHLSYNTGTSFSAPLVAQFAVRLFDAYRGASPNLVRGLLCHFAEPVRTPSPGAPVAAHDFCGFGEPRIQNALFATNHSSAYLFEGEIEKDTYLYIPFHVPQELVNDPASRLRIRGTVVFDPPVSADDSVNYSLCRVAARLRKRVQGGLREQAIGGDEEDALYPWNPLIHFEHSFRRGYASGEWELRLRLMTRGDLEAGFRQSVAAVIEIVDESGSVDVRNAIQNEAPVFAPVQLRFAA